MHTKCTSAYQVPTHGSPRTLLAATNWQDDCPKHRVLSLASAPPETQLRSSRGVTCGAYEHTCEKYKLTLLRITLFAFKSILLTVLKMLGS